MHYLILSDIHANREALEAVLRDADGRYQETYCCGDLVGYGADPAWVIAWTQSAVKLVVRGNHDKACAGLEDLEYFNPSARKSAEWTREILSEAELAYLTALPAGPLATEAGTMVHGSPLDEDEYLLQERDAAEVFDYLEDTVTFFGHTHLQGGFQTKRHRAKRLPPVPAKSQSNVMEIEPEWNYLINPGSVGQPRDGDPRAAYAIFDSDKRQVEYFRVAYDIAGAQSKIRAAGLPANLAERLAKGQ